jgi:hypothetical protein
MCRLPDPPSLPRQSALALLSVAEASVSAPVTLSFAKPPPLCAVRAVKDEPTLYECVFSEGEVGVDLGAFGPNGGVVRVVKTHPLGLPHLGDQVLAINGQTLEEKGEGSKDPLGKAQRLLVARRRPLVLRLQRSSGEAAAGEKDLTEQRPFSVLFLSRSLGLAFDTNAGLPIVVRTKPLFSRPRPGDLLTAINGAPVAASGLPVKTLALLLKALPRPVLLSFVEAPKALLDALKGGYRRVDGPLRFPEHGLKQVVLPRGRSIGLKLMTVMNRPVVAEVTSAFLWAQGVRPLDALVSIKGRKVGEASAGQAAQLLQKAKWEGGGGQFRVGFLRMAAAEGEGSYLAQHPVEVAAALTSYDPESREGALSFALPWPMALDKYRVEVFRFGSRIAPKLAEFSEGDQYLWVTELGKKPELTYAAKAELERAGENEEEAERRLQREEAQQVESASEDEGPPPATMSDVGDSDGSDDDQGGASD